MKFVIIAVAVLFGNVYANELKYLEKLHCNSADDSSVSITSKRTTRGKYTKSMTLNVDISIEDGKNSPLNLKGNFKVTNVGIMSIMGDGIIGVRAKSPDAKNEFHIMVLGGGRESRINVIKYRGKTIKTDDQLMMASMFEEGNDQHGEINCEL